MSRTPLSRLSSLLLLVALGLAVLSGCRQSVPPGTLVLSVRATVEELEVWQDAVKAFTEASKTPVVVRAMDPSRYARQLPGALAGKSAADVVLVDGTDISRLKQEQLLLPLDPYLPTLQDLKLSDYFLPAVQSCRREGATLALPIDLDTLVVVYNQDHFELSRLQPPTRGWSWQEYLRYAREITRESDSGKMTWGTAVCPWWQLHVWQNGGELVDNVNDPRRSTMGTPQAQEALQFLVDLYQKEKVAPPPAGTPVPAIVDAFCAGRIGMIYVTAAELPRISRARDLRWGLLPVPGGKRPANLAGGSGLAIPKACRQPDAAFKLLAYLAGGDGQKQLLKGSFTVPPLEFLANSEYFGARDVGGGSPFTDTMAAARQLPSTPRYTELQRIWDEELQALWSGETTVQAACQRIDERANQLLAAK